MVASHDLVSGGCADEYEDLCVWQSARAVGAVRFGLLGFVVGFSPSRDVSLQPTDPVRFHDIWGK